MAIRHLVAMILLAVLAWMPATRVDACCMLPEDFDGQIGQRGQRAVLLHHDGREELILSIDYRIEGDAMPDRFAWVITVPTEPDDYHLVGEEIYASVGSWALELVRPPEPVLSRMLTDMAPSKGADAALEFGERRQIGPYDIQPVRALGREALTGLNEWLGANGFPTEDPAHMAYFADHGFTFLCVKITPPGGAEAVGIGGDLPPLQLSFATQQPYYPLRFSSRQGVFNLSLYVLTSEGLDYGASRDELQRIRWSDRGYVRNVPVARADFPEDLAKAVDQAALAVHDGDWYLNVLKCSRVNRDGGLATWEDDIFFRTDPDYRPPLSGWWYAGGAGLLLVLALGGLVQLRAWRRSA